MGEYNELEVQSSAGMLGGIFYLVVLALLVELNVFLAIIHGLSFPLFYMEAMSKLFTFDFDKYWHSKGNFNRFLFAAVPTYALIRKYYLEKKEKK